MKKLNFIFLTLISLMVISSSSLLAQSDYAIVQNFKNEKQKIEQSIKNASSLNELNNLEYKIGQLRLDFLKNKDLLDKSLYPEDFESSLENLKATLKLRKVDFSQIDVLQTEVTQLQSQVDLLNAKNAELISQVQILEVQSKTDKSRIAQLEKSIAELRASMKKRDDLVMNMLDSLMPPPYRGAKVLSSKEKQNIYSEARKNNIIANLQRSIDDNIKFVKVTTLTPDDIEAIKKQQNDFVSLWQSIGPKIVDIYSGKGQNVNQLKEIDSSFTNWHDALIQQIWNSIRDKFNQHNIILSRFSSGEDFTNTITAYINDEIKNVDVKGNGNAEKSYKTFTDSVWFSEVKPNWVPYLIDNNMLSEAQKDTIENHITKWNAEVYPGGFNWMYLIIIVLIVVIVILFFVRRKSKDVNKETKNMNIVN